MNNSGSIDNFHNSEPLFQDIQIVANQLADGVKLAPVNCETVSTIDYHFIPPCDCLRFFPSQK